MTILNCDCCCGLFAYSGLQYAVLALLLKSDVIPPAEVNAWSECAALLEYMQGKQAECCRGQSKALLVQLVSNSPGMVQPELGV